MNKKEHSRLTKELKPLWKKLWKIRTNCSKKVALLERDMNKKVKLGFDLEFFYVDGEPVGIGAENYSDRKKFPLIQDSQLYAINSQKNTRKLDLKLIKQFKKSLADVKAGRIKRVA